MEQGRRWWKRKAERDDDEQRVKVAVVVVVVVVVVEAAVEVEAEVEDDLNHLRTNNNPLILPNLPHPSFQACSYPSPTCYYMFPMFPANTNTRIRTRTEMERMFNTELRQPSFNRRYRTDIKSRPA
ncbi:hypothetical protein ONZ45_g11879 [Pleurotus djamor]|nr:hypothetical protein ONZ45_g11879 [Pleurotus djamor]